MKRNRAWCVGFLALVMVIGLAGCEPTPTTIPKQGEFTVTSKDGIPIEYEVAGKGDITLVFVHCWSCNRSFWDGQFKAFANGYRVVRLDLVGHGSSGHGRSQYNMASFGTDVVAVVEDLNLHKVVLIGHSMGGPVSLEAAKLLGDRVIGVVGVDTFYTGFPYPRDDAGIETFVKPFKEDFDKASTGMLHSMFPPATDPALVDAVVKVILQADQKMALQAMYDVFYWSQREVPSSLEALGNKLRNINGDPEGKNQKLHPSVTLVTGTGHYVQMEKPAAFNTVLTGVVKGFGSAK